MFCCTSQSMVVSYRNSTSNHNVAAQFRNFCRLYLIEILHQTTTRELRFRLVCSCILSKFYIKPQQAMELEDAKRRCILSKFYIKPQLSLPTLIKVKVVSYRNSTSNHNNNFQNDTYSMLYLIEILHQTTTPVAILLAHIGCILSKFYIKPQHECPPSVEISGCILSKFYIKPQQTSDDHDHRRCCILSKFYIKPQRPLPAFSWRGCCILSKFYIKPQLYQPKAFLRDSCILSKFYIKPQRLETHSKA